MKRVIGALVVGMSLLAVGCSDGRIKSVDDDEVLVVEGPKGEQPRGEEVGTSQQALNTAEVRIRAENAEAFTRLMLVPNSVRVFADGVELAVTPTFREVNLANMAHAEKLATFEIPVGARNITYKLDLGAAGGFDSATSSGYVDTRNSVLTFAMSGAELEHVKRAVVIVDARRSFVQRDDGTLSLVPNYRVD